MLALIAVEVLPSAYARGTRLGPTTGLAAGAALMAALSFALGV